MSITPSQPLVSVIGTLVRVFTIAFLGGVNNLGAYWFKSILAVAGKLSILVCVNLLIMGLFRRSEVP